MLLENEGEDRYKWRRRRIKLLIDFLRELDVKKPVYGMSPCELARILVEEEPDLASIIMIEDIEDAKEYYLMDKYNLVADIIYHLLKTESRRLHARTLQRILWERYGINMEFEEAEEAIRFAIKKMPWAFETYRYKGLGIILHWREAMDESFLYDFLAKMKFYEEPSEYARKHYLIP